LTALFPPLQQIIGPAPAHIHAIPTAVIPAIVATAVLALGKSAPIIVSAAATTLSATAAFHS
jgi:hypothetical protein